MVKIFTRSLHVPGMTQDERRVLDTVVAYAEANKERRVHDMPLTEFSDIAKLPADTNRREVIRIMSKIRRATVSVKVEHESHAEKCEVLAGGWPVFLSILVTGTNISFEVCSYMWEDIEARLSNR